MCVCVSRVCCVYASVVCVCMGHVCVVFVCISVTSVCVGVGCRVCGEDGVQWPRPSSVRTTRTGKRAVKATIACSSAGVECEQRLHYRLV